jgi:hypothetical protein
MRKALILTSFVALVLVAVGCGGGGSSSSAHLSASEFQSKANAICSEHKVNTQHMTSAHDWDAALKATNDTFARLKGLDPPPSMEAKYQAYLNSLEAGISVLTKLVKAADNNQFAQAAKLAPQAAVHIRQSEAAARAAGLHVCAEV